MTPNTDGRTTEGRFAPGNAYGKGNPQARRMAEIRQSLLDAATPDRARAIINRMGDLAAEGDVPAARIWLEYAVGKPAQALELSGPDGEPLGVDWPKLQAVLLGALGRFPEARVAVAVALKGLSDDVHDDATVAGDAARPEPADDGPRALP